MTPKGTVLIIGGSEERGEGESGVEQQNKLYERFELLRELLPKKGRKDSIEIITTASDIPKEVEKMYLTAFKKIGFTNIGFIDVQDKKQARDPQYIERVEKAHTVLFSGGDQFKLSTILGGTDLMTSVKERFWNDKDFVLAGTSAGAMAIPKIMIYEGGVREAIFKEDLKITSGMGFFDTCIVDTHFIERGRFGRLAHAITMNPESLGIGLGEDTAFIIKKGCDAECRGSGMIVIIDGGGIEQTNIAESEEGIPIYVENLKVHLLVKGSKFSLKDRKMATVKNKTN